MIGSLVQGLGGAVLEDLKYDAQGQFLTGSLADYLLPTASDFPNLRCFVTDDHPSPINPLGAKGAGEGGIVAAGGCMANAVANALQIFGVQPRALPLSPAYIWEMVQAGRDLALSLAALRESKSVAARWSPAALDIRLWLLRMTGMDEPRAWNRFLQSVHAGASMSRRPPSAPERA